MEVCIFLNTDNIKEMDIHRVIGTLDIFGTVHDGAEFTLLHAWNVNYDILLEKKLCNLQHLEGIVNE